MKRCWILWLALCLSACASVPVPPAHSLLDDSLFDRSTPPPTAAEVFAVSEPMRRFVEEDLARESRRKGPRTALIDALYAPGQLKLEYDAQRTRTAAEAFDARSGNCLSLVI